MSQSSSEMRGDFGPAECPICGSVGARALMLDHIEAEHADLVAALKTTAAFTRNQYR
jgi:hypothetical protein